jgi:hypothetical protein
MPNDSAHAHDDQRRKGDSAPRQDRKAAILRLVGGADDQPLARPEIFYPEAITCPVPGEIGLAKVPRRLKVPEVPDHLLTIPGVLGQAVDHYNHCSTRTQPQFAVHSALALGSVICARYWSTDRDNFTSLYLVSLGPTGSGKEYGRKFLAKVLAESGLGYLTGPRRYASGAGVIGELAYKPRHAVTFDEFGRLLDSTRKNSSNTNLRDAQTVLIDIFGMLEGEVRPDALSTNNKTREQIEEMRSKVIERPALTLLGLSTPETFFDALSQDDVANGFLNRLLVVQTDRDHRAERHSRRWHPIPGRLKRWLIDKGAAPDECSDIEGHEDPLDLPEPFVVPFSSEAAERLFEIECIVDDIKQHLVATRLDALWSRSVEITQRISLIVALSRHERKGGAPDHVSTQDVDWAWEYVRFYTRRMVENTQRDMGSTPVIRVTDQLAELIIEAGSNGMSLRNMNRMPSFEKMTEREREEVIKRLASVHQIREATPIKSPKGGRPTKLFVQEKYIVQRRTL